jgi:Holliday junction resolvase RusA-like endonuclease
MSLTVTVPGTPRGWRQNHTARGRAVQSYLVANASAWQRAAIALIRQQWGPREAMSGAVRLQVTGVFLRPKRLDCQHKRKPCSCPPEMLDGRPMPHTSTPDATNVHKLAEDALVKAGVLVDDRLVVEYSGSMRYAARGEAPCVCISVREMT